MYQRKQNHEKIPQERQTGKAEQIHAINNSKSYYNVIKEVCRNLFGDEQTADCRYDALTVLTGITDKHSVGWCLNVIHNE